MPDCGYRAWKYSCLHYSSATGQITVSWVAGKNDIPMYLAMKRSDHRKSLRKDSVNRATAAPDMDHTVSNILFQNTWLGRTHWVSQCKDCISTFPDLRFVHHLSPRLSSLAVPTSFQQRYRSTTFRWRSVSFATQPITGTRIFPRCNGIVKSHRAGKIGIAIEYFSHQKYLDYWKAYA